MSTSVSHVIMNGSPNGKKGNTEIFIRQFIEGFEKAPDILYIADEDPAALAAKMVEYDSWLFFFPMYVNAMPGIVKRLFEHMQPSAEKKVGFFVQYGFEEGAQSDYLVRLLENFMVRMGYQSMGIVVSGGHAGVRYMPASANKKLFERLKVAGSRFEQTGRLDDETPRNFERVRSYSPSQIRLYKLLRRLGLTDIFWNRMLKQNNAFEKRFDRPFGV